MSVEAQVDRIAPPDAEDIEIAYYGRLLKHFTYDGLGRLVRTVSPYPSPDLWTGMVRSERYYYDGARRVQEVAVAGLVTPEDFGELEIEYPVPPQSQPDPLDPNVYTLIPTPLDTSVPPLYVEQGQLDAGTVHVGLVREYVWGTGDSFPGVDELLAQFDEGRQAWWVLQDASGDIVAQVKSHPPTGPPEAEDRALPSLAARYDYDAYGKVTGAWLNDALGEPVPSLAAGHKGLFFDNLNENRVYPVSAEHQPMTLTDLLLGVREPRHTTWAEPVYHVRNRNLMPRYGRWLQRDMNATGQVVHGIIAFHGRGLGGSLDRPDLLSLYTDGGNLHGYCGDSPLVSSDPNGLFIGTLASTAMTFGVIGVSAARGALEGMIGTYGANLEADVEWAMDWSLGDNDHSRLSSDWVALSAAEGTAAGLQEGLELLEALDPLTYILEPSRLEQPMAAGLSNLVSYGVTVGGKALLRRAGLAVAYARHHALPQYITKTVGLTSPVLAHIPKHLHEAYHGALDSALTGMKCARAHGAKGVKLYRDQFGAAGVGRLLKTIRNTTVEFETAHGLNGLLEATDRALHLNGIVGSAL